MKTTVKFFFQKINRFIILSLPVIINSLVTLLSRFILSFLAVSH